jgi:hypothetical protein
MGLRVRLGGTFTFLRLEEPKTKDRVAWRLNADLN